VKYKKVIDVQIFGVYGECQGLLGGEEVFNDASVKHQYNNSPK